MIIIIIILTVLLIRSLYRILPSSNVPYKEFNTTIELTDNRQFDVLSDELFTQIHQVDDVSIFKGYQGKRKLLKDGDIVQGLIFILNNKIEWSDNTYFKRNDKCYFPKPNSTIIATEPITFHGKDIYVIN